MSWLFLICAVIGGTAVVCQFAMTLMGLGDDVHLETDVPHDFSGDAGHDADGATAHDSSWLFSVISFRTLTAAFTFFGLAGYAMHANGSPPASQLIVAVLSGVGALFAVNWLFGQLHRLSADGTEQIARAVGEIGRVYLTVPSRGGGVGKVQFELQGRLVEYPAVTNSLEPLPTGAKIRVVAVSGNVVEVADATVPSKVEAG